jgi:hypothetical protein
VADRQQKQAASLESGLVENHSSRAKSANVQSSGTAAEQDAENEDDNQIS